VRPRLLEAAFACAIAVRPRLPVAGASRAGRSRRSGQELEILVLWQQLSILRRQVRQRRFEPHDRLLLSLRTAKRGCRRGTRQTYLGCLNLTNPGARTERCLSPRTDIRLVLGSARSIRAGNLSPLPTLRRPGWRTDTRAHRLRENSEKAAVGVRDRGTGELHSG
jgi:hypothetical protein